LRRSRNTHAESRDTPTTSPKTALSRCHPIGVPGRYSLTIACGKSEGASDAKAAARSRTGRRKSGISPAGWSSRSSYLYCQPK
jgi:hypothetical protein